MGITMSDNCELEFVADSFVMNSGSELNVSVIVFKFCCQDSCGYNLYMRINTCVDIQC